MRLERVRLKNFRNIEATDYQCSTFLNGVWGRNGQGKTNFLESIYMSIKGKSFRPYCDKKEALQVESLNFGKKSFLPMNVSLELVDSKTFPITVEMMSTSHGKFSFALNGKKTRSSIIQYRIPVVSFSPDDQALIRGGPELRRDFINDVFTEIVPGYSEVLSRFETSLKNRNRCLKMLKEQSHQNLQTELKTWTKVFATEAWELAKIRSEIWPDFCRVFLEVAGELLKANTQDSVEMSWKSFPREIQNVDELEKYILEAYPQDQATGWTHRGPQREDFLITLGGREAKSSASQAQARLLALSLKWAHSDWIESERQENAIFLVDDFSSELDPHSRSALNARISRDNAQVFFTGTDHSMVDSGAFSDYKYSEVEMGKMTTI